MFQEFGDQLPTLLPFLITAFMLLIWALMDLLQRPSSGYRWGNRTIWAFIVLTLTIIGPLLYLTFARKNDDP